MRLKLAAIICTVVLFCGCQKTDSDISRALMLRNKLVASNGCSFQAEIVADYGEDIYTFTLECEFNQLGDMTFRVNEPDVIHGIQGEVSENTGKLTFDDKVVAFQTMADGQLTPVIAPWLFIKTLRNGYINGCSNTDEGLFISVDDSFEENALHLNIWIDDTLMPQKGEIYWQGRRVLTIFVEFFTFL